MAADADATRSPTASTSTRLTSRERAVLGTLDDVDVRDGVARRAGSADPLADHPFVARPRRRRRRTRPIRTGCRATRSASSSAAAWSSSATGSTSTPATIDAAAALAARLLAGDPDGFTTCAVPRRDRHHPQVRLPLLTELDARGITRRRGDLRIAGPRLPRRAGA